jgi:HAE1 family hydrophobic/amphiphilic exporter-1
MTSRRLACLFTCALVASRPAAAQEGANRSDRPLTLTEASELALAHNLDIAVERVNVPSADLEITGLKAAYLPTLNGLAGDLQQTSVPVTLLNGGPKVKTNTATFNASVTENVPWGGGAASATWNNNRVGTNSVFYNYNPAFNSTITFQYTQPLWRGFHTDAVRQQLLVTKANRSITDLQLKATVANTLSSVRNAYWDLVFAVDSIEAAKKAVDLAHALVDENEKRVAAGTMTELDLVSARSQEATARHQLVSSEGNRRSAEVALKRLLVAGAEDPLWQATLTPVDRPALSNEPVDVDAAVRRALADRTDLAEARQQVAANEATYKYLVDQTKPQADVVGTYAIAGLGGSRIIRGGDPTFPFNAPIIGTDPASYGSALNSLLGFNYPTWGIAVTLSYPIGFSAVRADAARARLQIGQVETELHRIEVGIVTDVTNAAVNVRNDVDNVQTATTARELAEQRLDAEQKRFGAGMSTNFQVVQAQKDLTDARNAELQAQVTYRKSLVEFDRVQQTTLQSAGVTLLSPSIGLPSVGSGRAAGTAPSGVFIQ